MESADLDAIADLLAPNVTWGPPGAKSPPCQSKQQVLQWYQRGKFAGATARITDLEVKEDKILIGLVVLGLDDEHHGDPVVRWQVFTVAHGLITDIVGFEEKGDAVDWIEEG